jgi:hypothetical protein
MLLRAVVILLSLQFLLGMWVNLFAAVPTTHNLAAAVGDPGDPVLVGHYALAVVLIVLGAFLVVVAFRSGARRTLVGTAVLGFLSLLWASAAGVEFVLSGFSSNVDSFSMALAFVAATSCYGVARALVVPRVPEAAHRPPGEELPGGRRERDP